jgi:hypothetical protein
MRHHQIAGENDRFVRRYEYDDGWVIAADLDVSDEAVDVDVVGRTAILVVESADRVSETEFELPGPDGSVTVNNGIVSVRGERA